MSVAPAADTTITRQAVDDDGYFPRRRSVLRTVHEQRAVGLTYGQRALGIGALHPVNFVGTIEHTRGRDRPFKRLVRTAKMFETVFFGTRAQADEVLAMVDHMHKGVHGVLPAQAGTFPAGTPYSAMDPQLMLWTVAVIADSAQVMYELFVRRLTDGERESLWQDYLRFGELFGMPRDSAPATYDDFRAYWEQRLASPESQLTDDARHVGSAIMFAIPVPATHALAMRAHNLVIAGSLPPRVRELYGVRWTAAHQAAFRAVVSTARAQRPLAPARLRRGWNTRFFDLVGETENRLAARGRPIPGALA